ncbi:Hint domain-containing protein [Roseobacter sp. YSTF-M11]|uniref:Hint domain-containing protein n=1 Tax=Roseobacter insulae TaxID=2859783 RepID=A0A9X1FZ48_9RHOB|nr:Hint domain-containing protein [Roseobacter insulae]MBW4710394.1 Hint domain-containing protein [Roseobacter insulae]
MKMYGWSVNVSAKPDRRVRTPKTAMPVSHGLIAGTRVASNFGWRAAEALTVGDKVLTFDNGVQPIVDIQRTTIWTEGTEVAPGFWPVVIPAGALGNAQDVTLLPDQGVMLESDAASDPLGDPFAVVPAQALEGLCGIHRSPPLHPVELITFYFARDEVIYIDGGLLIHCPRGVVLLQDMMAPSEVLYDVMSAEHARDILRDSEVARQALVQSGGYVFGATEMVLVA